MSGFAGPMEPLSDSFSDAQELPAPVTREAPFYSDLRKEQIPVRSLREATIWSTRCG